MNQNQEYTRTFDSRTLVLVVEAAGGAAFDLFIRDLIIMALTEDRKVKGKHNEKWYLVNPNNVINLVIKNCAES